METKIDVQPFTVSNDLISDPGALIRRLRQDGYLFFSKLLPRESVLNVRSKILKCCEEEGWLRPGTDPDLGLTDHAPVFEGAPAYAPVYAKVQRLQEFHALKLHPALQNVMRTVFDEPVVALPNTIARISFPRDPENTTQPHQDWLYIQGSTETLSAWVPLGDVPLNVGGLRILKGSHKAGILFPRKATGGAGGHTVDLDPELQWVSADYQAGDVLIFTALTIHAAMPNLTNEVLRLSLDCRYVGVGHAVCATNLPPHMYWRGEDFTWDRIERDWGDSPLKRYWERGPKLKTVPHEPRFFAK